jgi:hypothetical protein
VQPVLLVLLGLLVLPDLRARLVLMEQLGSQELLVKLVPLEKQAQLAKRALPALQDPPVSQELLDPVLPGLMGQLVLPGLMGQLVLPGFMVRQDL